LLGETALIDGPHGVRMRQARRQHLLEAPGDGLVVPPGFGQEALQHAGRRAFDRFGEVLGIAPLGGLDEEAPQVVPAARAPLLATERRGEGGMKLTKGFLDACEFLQIHGIAPGAASAPRSYLIRLTRRCNTKRTMAMARPENRARWPTFSPATSAAFPA